MSVTIEDLQEESTLPIPFAGAPQLNATEAMTFKFARMTTVIAFPNYLGNQTMFDDH